MVFHDSLFAFCFSYLILTLNNSFHSIRNIVLIQVTIISIQVNTHLNTMFILFWGPTFNGTYFQGRECVCQFVFHTIGFTCDFRNRCCIPLVSIIFSISLYFEFSHVVFIVSTVFYSHGFLMVVLHWDALVGQ